MLVARSTEPHVWRQALAVFSLQAWTFVLVSWLLIHLIGLISLFHPGDLPFAPLIYGWTWDDNMALVLRVMQTTG